MGLHHKQITKATYNHFDSYPDGVGADILQELKEALKEHGLEKLRQRFEKIVMIKKGNEKPSPEMIEKYDKHKNTGVGGPMNNTEVKTWYQLLRNTQGSLKPYFDGTVEHMIDSLSFIYDSLFCEWVYIVNLDEELLEVYEGFQEKPHTLGRYSKGPKTEAYDKTEYYPCKLIKTFKFDELPSKNEFVKQVNKVSDEEEK